MAQAVPVDPGSLTPRRPHLVKQNEPQSPSGRSIDGWPDTVPHDSTGAERPASVVPAGWSLVRRRSRAGEADHSVARLGTLCRHALAERETGGHDGATVAKLTATALAVAPVSGGRRHRPVHGATLWGPGGEGPPQKYSYEPGSPTQETESLFGRWRLAALTAVPSAKSYVPV